MEAKNLFMFSGQGSHYFQMGREFMHQNEVFTRYLEEGDTILEGLGQPGFLDRVYGNPQTEAWLDLYATHPGLVIIQYATFQMLKAEGIVPDAVLGSSLGVFAAAAASELLVFEDAVEAAYHQAELIVENCEQGGILALLASPDVYRQIPRLQELVSIGGVNYAEHFIVSGFTAEIESAKVILQNQGVNHQELAVNYAFHSNRVQPAELPFETWFDQIPKSRPSVPWIIQNDQHEAVEVDGLPQGFFWEAVAGPMDFAGVIRSLSQSQELRYVDVGPSGTLATFVKHNLSKHLESQIFPVLTPFHTGRKNLGALKEAVFG